MDYILGLDFLNEANQIQMEGYVIEQLGIQAIQEFSKDTIKNLFTRAREFIDKQLLRFKEWVTKIFKPAKQKLDKLNEKVMSKAFKNGRTIKFEYELQEMNPDMFSELDTTVIQIYNSIIKKTNDLKTNMSLYISSENELVVSDWINKSPKIVQTKEEVEAKIPLNKAKNHNLFIIEKISAINNQVLSSAKRVKKTLDDAIDAYQKNIQQAANILKEFKDDMSRVENDMRDGYGKPGSKNVVGAYSALIKSINLAGSLMVSVKNQLTKAVSYYVEFLKTVATKLKLNDEYSNNTNTSNNQQQAQTATA